LHALYIFLHIFISNSNSGEKRTTVLSNYWIINLIFIFRHQHLMSMNQQCLLLLINNNKNNNPNLDLTQGTFPVFSILSVSNTFIILEQNDAQTNLFLLVVTSCSDFFFFLVLFHFFFHKYDFSLFIFCSFSSLAFFILRLLLVTPRGGKKSVFINDFDWRY
jgi:hypothetical protein